MSKIIYNDIITKDNIQDYAERMAVCATRGLARIMGKYQIHKLYASLIKDINTTTKSRMAELEQRIDELNGKILVEESKLKNSITKEEVMKYLTDSVRYLSPQVLIEVLVNRIELYDDEIIVWFNYSERTNPDDPDTDSRDFILQENYKMTVTSRFVIASIKITLR